VYIAGGNVEQYSPYGKVLPLSQKVKYKLSYEPSIPLPGIRSRELRIYVYPKAYTLYRMFRAA
jgi:hypothetical protein